MAPLVCLTNGGGIRADLPAGDVTFGDVTAVLPFGNTVEVLEVSGSTLREALEHGYSAVRLLSHKLWHLSLPSDCLLCRARCRRQRRVGGSAAAGAEHCTTAYTYPCLHLLVAVAWLRVRARIPDELVITAASFGDHKHIPASQRSTYRSR